MSIKSDAMSNEETQLQLHYRWLDSLSLFAGRLPRWHWIITRESVAFITRRGT